ncbi:MAG: AtpZ/AtpI family protein [Proteobacteria bacterium]|nr:AtpZ/AtpI family protein [Pseudomonadota bacterium]
MSDRDDKPSPVPPSLESVEARLAVVREERAVKAAKEASQAAQSQGLGLGMRIGIELLVSVLAGVGIGLLLDNWLETMPIFTLAFVSVGFAAGVMNTLRVSRGLDEKIGLGRAVREKDAADAASGKTAETPKAPPKAWDDDDE